MLYGIEIDDNGDTTPLTSNRRKAMQKARRLAVKRARYDNRLDDSRVFLLTFNDWQGEGEPNNAHNAIGHIVYTGSSGRWGDHAYIDHKDGITEENY